MFRPNVAIIRFSSAKYDANEVERTHPLDGRQVHAHTKRTGHRYHHRYKG